MLQQHGALREALRHRDFAYFVAGKTLLSLAVQVLHVAVGWQVYALTRDPLDLGLIGLSQFLPFVVFVLPAGQLADRVDRKTIVMACYTLHLLASGALLALVWMGPTRVWPIFLVMMVLGVARAFMSPALQSLLPNLVPRNFFSQAVALNSSTWQLAALSGPAVGGLLYLAGAEVAFGVSTALIAAGFLLAVKMKAPAMPERPLDAPVVDSRWHEVLAGLKFVWQRPKVLGAMSLDLFAVLFGGATALLPAVASDLLNVGPAGLGLLRAAPGVGATVVALVLASYPPVRHCGRWVFFSVGLYGLSTVAFGWSTSFWLSLIVLVVMGGADMLSVYIRQLLVQLETPDALRGRVSAVNSMFIGASNELGEFESGVTASWWGVRPAILVGGFATLAVTVVFTRVFPELFRLDRMPTRAHDA
jgi:MFS family permease